MQIKKLKIVFLCISFVAPLYPMQSATFEWQSQDKLHMTFFKFGTKDKDQLKNRALQEAKTAQANITVELQAVDLLTKTAGPIAEFSPHFPEGRKDIYETFLTELPSATNPWYLIFVFSDPSREATENFYKTIIGSWGSEKFKLPYLDKRLQQQPKFYPHITLAKITQISDTDTFYKSLVEANKFLGTLQPQEKRFNYMQNNLELLEEPGKKSILAIKIPESSFIAKTSKKIQEQFRQPLSTPQLQPTPTPALQNALQTLQQALESLRSALAGV